MGLWLKSASKPKLSPQPPHQVRPANRKNGLQDTTLQSLILTLKRPLKVLVYDTKYEKCFKLLTNGPAYPLTPSSAEILGKTGTSVTLGPRGSPWKHTQAPRPPNRAHGPVLLLEPGFRHHREPWPRLPHLCDLDCKTPQKSLWKADLHLVILK